MVLMILMLELVLLILIMGADAMKRRLLDFFKGIGYGMGSGVVAFGCGYMLGKMVVLGYSTAMELQGWIAT